MQCTKNVSRELLLAKFHSEKERLLRLLCEYLKNLKQTRNLGVNCFKDKVHQLGSGYLISDYSTRLRKLNAIKNGKGRLQFSSLLLNDYGKIQGSPGGYGSSPKNRF